jgi:hypothetical protein
LGRDTPRKWIEANRGVLAFNLFGGDLQPAGQAMKPSLTGFVTPYQGWRHQR